MTTKLSLLPAASVVSPSDIMYIVQGGLSKKVTANLLLSPIPNQSGNTDKFLSTNGNSLLWAVPPVQSVFGRLGVIAPVSGDYSVGQVTGAAPLASPALSGVPTAPTAAGGNNTTQLATTAFVQSAIPVTSVFGRTGAVSLLSSDVTGALGYTPGTGNGSVTTLSVVNANGVSGTVTNPTTTPAITLTLGSITPSSIIASGAVSGSNLSGTNTGDQTITLTGDVTGSGAGSFAATIANSAVTLAKQANVATSSVFYRKTAGSGAPEVNTLATLKTDLGLTGTNSGDQTITLTGDVTGSGVSTFAATIANSAVTLAKHADMATASLYYRKTAGNGPPEVTALATLKTDLGLTGTNSGDQTVTLTGDVTGSGTGSFAATIANNAVTYAKFQQVAASSLVGNPTGSLANASGITLGTNLSFSGSVLNATGGGASLADPTGTIGLSNVVGSASTAMRSDAAPPLSQAIAPTWTNKHIFAPTARTSGSASWWAAQTPADTTLAASTESIGMQFGGDSTAAQVQRQWSTGALATQREYLFVAPKLRAVGSSTITTAATVAITGAPTADTNMAITKPYALWVQLGRSRFDGAAGSPCIDLGAGYGDTTAANAKILLYNDGAGSTGLYGFGINAAAMNYYAGNAAVSNWYTADVIQMTFTSGLVAVRQGQATFSGAKAKVGGSIFDHFADASTTHTDGTEDTIYTDTVAASVFGTNGDSIEGFVTFQSVASATANRQVQFYVAGTVCFDTTSTTFASAVTGLLKYWIVRESSSILRVTTELSINGVTFQDKPVYTKITGLTLTNTQIIKLTGIASGTGAASGDITGVMGKYRWFPAA